MSESKCHTCTKVCSFRRRDAVCPVCQGTLILEEDGHKYGCCDCYFGCNPEDLPSIAAAMEAEARHNALKDAVRPVVEWWKNDGPFLRANTAEQLDALAALVGGEK